MKIATHAWVKDLLKKVIARRRITVSAVTLISGTWNNGEYLLEDTFPAARYTIDVMPNGDSITEEQLTAWEQGRICGSGSANKLKALGTQPEVDIPVIVKAIGV